MKSYEHENVACYECLMEPIRTDRFKCLTCDSDYDLCLYCYCRSANHPKTHKFQVLGPLGIVIVKESEVQYMQKRGQILKKEVFFRNVGEELELTVRPYKQVVQPQIVGGQMQQIQIQPHLQEF